MKQFCCYITILVTAATGLCEQCCQQAPYSHDHVKSIEKKALPFDDATISPLSKEELIAEIEIIFLQEGTPPEYVCIAEVESNFDPNAISSAGAAGIFQLMPDTARRFGLKVEDDIDERFDPLKNARAAARYLNFLKNYFGNWHIAIIAYNAGEGRVSRVIQSLNNDNKSLEDILSMLPEETQKYLPKVVAALDNRMVNKSIVR